MGCQAFCCKLLVRLRDDEGANLCGQSGKRFLDKDPEDGYCIFFDRDNLNCTSWQNRPETCSAYECSGDKLLQIALEEKDLSIVELAIKAQKRFLPKETWVEIPEKHD